MSAIVEKEGFNDQPVCVGCKNYIKGLKCKAFDLIPDEILLNGNKHNKPLINQKNNIVFEQTNNKK